MLLVVVAALVSCGKWPPIVESARDVRRLDANETSVRARGLPDEDIPSLAHLENLDYLDFSGGWAVKKAKISDAGLKALSEVPFRRLDTLSLGYCDRITDAGLTNLVGMKTVRWLSLMVCTNITDNGLSNLTSMTTLHALDLRGCPQITDKGLTHLARMTNLRQVLLGGCPNISESGVQQLQKALPACRVEKDEQEWSYHSKK